MDLRHLHAFVAVAEERHFGRAAKRLHISQPPLSRQIQTLEAELGFSLFERTRRRVEITPAGVVFLAQVRRVFESLELAVREARRASIGEIGRLAMGYPSSLAYSGLTELLRAFRARFSTVELSLRELSPSEQIEAIKERRLDVGFVRGPLDDAGLVSEVVRREPLVVALPADHRLAGRSRIALGALAREPFVVFPRQRGPAFFDQLVSMCRRAGFTPHIVQEAPQLDILSLVAAGFGVAILPASIREARRDGIVVRPIVAAPSTELLVTWRADNASPVLREFLELVRRVGVRGTRPPTRLAKGRRRAHARAG
jgi:DNA-binding transcriptional LysR family regulator